MKVNEILNEGPLDYLKGLVKTGSFAGGSDASQQAEADKQLKQYVEKVVQSWNNYTGTTKRTDVVAWANKFFDGDTSEYVQGLQNTPQGIRDFLTNVTRAYKAKELPPLEAAQAQQTAQPVPAQQPEPAQQQKQVYRSPLNIRVISSAEPKILRYKGKDYMLNNRGAWAIDGKDNHKLEASQPLAAEMNKIDDSL